MKFCGFKLHTSIITRGKLFCYSYSTLGSYEIAQECKKKKQEMRKHSFSLHQWMTLHMVARWQRLMCKQQRWHVKTACMLC